MMIRFKFDFYSFEINHLNTNANFTIINYSSIDKAIEWKPLPIKWNSMLYFDMKSFMSRYLSSKSLSIVILAFKMERRLNKWKILSSSACEAYDELIAHNARMCVCEADAIHRWFEKHIGENTWETIRSIGQWIGQ